MSVLVRLIVLGVFVVGCAPSRPIAPARVTTSKASAASEFDADQRARLDALHAALAEPRASVGSGGLAGSLESAGSGPSEAPSERALSDGLIVQLAFDEAADLDLFVTDPAQESVYFANSPSRSGGTLVVDRRCDDPSPRIEVVHFAQPAPGRYRVGVDFHRRCQDTPLSGSEEKQGLYVVRVEEDGRILIREGQVIPGQFEVIVIEFDLD